MKENTLLLNEWKRGTESWLRVVTYRRERAPPARIKIAQTSSTLHLENFTLSSKISINFVGSFHENYNCTFLAFTELN